MLLFSTLSTTPNGRHAKRGATPAVAVTGLAAVFVASLASTASAAMPAGTDQDMSRLRACESGSNYGTDTGNGYYGAYQFDVGTWRGLGYTGVASQASPATQDEAAARLQSDRGWTPWPGCTAKLGLGQNASAADPGSADAASATAARASRGGQRSAAVIAPIADTTAASAAAGYAGRTITTDDVDSDLAAVRTWQTRMAQRGWDIAVDGQFGPQSAGVASRFAAEKGLSPELSGSLDKTVYTGAWTIAVS